MWNKSNEHPPNTAGAESQRDSEREMMSSTRSMSFCLTFNLDIIACYDLFSSQFPGQSDQSDTHFLFRKCGNLFDLPQF